MASRAVILGNSGITPTLSLRILFHTWKWSRDEPVPLDRHSVLDDGAGHIEVGVRDPTDIDPRDRFVGRCPADSRGRPAGFPQADAD
jgi:hypothetical protein